MALCIGETLRWLRIKKGLTQQQLADTLHIDRTSLARWETGQRIPDVSKISLLASVLDVDPSVLLSPDGELRDTPNIILVDDERIILDECLSVLREAAPGAVVTGFTSPSKAKAYAKENPLDVAFLDIEMGMTSGLDLCRELLRLRPHTNVIFLTGFKEYSYEAWDTGACGYLLKPLSLEDVRSQLSKLRYPVLGLL